MITFITAILLVLGIFYGKFVESIFKPDVNRATPAYTHADGVDFVPMNSNKTPDSSFKYCGSRSNFRSN
jgi:carbon starvation protein CstA